MAIYEYLGQNSAKHNKIGRENIRITIHDPILLTNELVYKINHDVVNTHSERRFRMSCTAKVSFCAYYRGGNYIGIFGKKQFKT